MKKQKIYNPKHWKWQDMLQTELLKHLTFAAPNI